MSELNGRPRPVSAPMAFLSDVHGNLPALEAVLDEIERRAIHEIYVAGDLLLGGEQPVEVFKRLSQVGAKCIRGLSDNALTRIRPESLRPSDEGQRALAERFAATRSQIGELALKFLEKLPEERRIPMVDGSEILVVHGSPADPSVEISHDLTDDEVLALIADDPADIVVCGASHVPFQRDLDGLRVINVGSVGAAPEGRVAHYTVITPNSDGTTLIEQTYVEY
ncbi:MAG: metallophosphoesterase family protein [Candidatus Brachytrichaceae bacterium NZ_4S206]|jgi:putative phosphoesterase